MNLRWRLFLPLALALLVVIAYALWQQPVTNLTSLLLLGTVVGLLLATWFSVELFVLKPLAQLRASIAELGAEFALIAPHTVTRPLELRDLPAQLVTLRERLHDYGGQLALESSRRQRVEQTLREAEERFALAVRGASDGCWEWDLKTDAMYFSPLWRAMLGYGEQEIGQRVETWRELIHPDDRQRAINEIDNHLNGLTQRFEFEARLKHGDGRWHWVLVRGTALRHASGKPYRVVGLNSDISARKQVQDAVIELADKLTVTNGADALRELVHTLAQFLNVREVFVNECVDYPTTRMRKLAHWYAGEFRPEKEWELEGTACKDCVVDGKIAILPDGVAERFPDEGRQNRHSFIGVPILSAGGTVIGHIACYDGKPMRDAILPHDAILKLFALRASIELERRLLTKGNDTFVHAAA